MLAQQQHNMRYRHDPYSEKGRVFVDPPMNMVVFNNNIPLVPYEPPEYIAVAPQVRHANQPAHAPEWHPVPADEYKTRMCNHAMAGQCKRGNTCQFAHNAAELCPYSQKNVADWNQRDRLIFTRVVNNNVRKCERTIEDLANRDRQLTRKEQERLEVARSTLQELDIFRMNVNDDL